jgi:hypothetical protein
MGDAVNKLSVIVMAGALVALANNVNAEEVGPLQGCPMKGIEPKCILLKAQDGQTYDISRATKKPKPNYLVIYLKGTKSSDVGVCREGIVLDHIRWGYTRMRCPH